MMVFRWQFCAIALLAGLGLACDHTAAAAKGTCAAFAAIDPDNSGWRSVEQGMGELATVGVRRTYSMRAFR